MLDEPASVTKSKHFEKEARQAHGSDLTTAGDGAMLRIVGTRRSQDFMSSWHRHARVTEELPSRFVTAGSSFEEDGMDGARWRPQQALLDFLSSATEWTGRGEICVRRQYSATTGLLRIEVGMGMAVDAIEPPARRWVRGETAIIRRCANSGLGLAVCGRLMGLMQGRIGIESRLGLGPLFWIEIPLQRQNPSDEHVVSNVPPASPEGRHILLVERSPFDRDVIAAVLVAAGHDVTAVGDSAGAIAAMAERRDIDCILLDLQSPIIDGLQASRTIRAMERANGGRRTPIIGLTANASAEDAYLCLGAGMDAHDPKPINWPHLQATIQRIAADDSSDPSAALGAEVFAPVHVEATLDDLAACVSRKRICQIITRFVDSLQSTAPRFAHLSDADLAAQMHSWKTAAAQFGFMEFSNLCIEVEEAALDARARERVPALIASAQRAILAARASSYWRSDEQQHGDGIVSRVPPRPPQSLRAAGA